MTRCGSNEIWGAIRRVVILLLLAFSTNATASEVLHGEVVGISDGDTLTILVMERPRKIRLAEIDTAERGQPWASKARQALSDKVFRRQIEVRVVDTDRYGRTVGHVWLGGRHVNREMVREGHAWVYERYLQDETLLEDEAHARDSGIGLWSLPEAQHVPPWTWRRNERRERAPERSPPPRVDECGVKSRCSEMSSCEEARFHLDECGLVRLDGDGDGLPCEALCR